MASDESRLCRWLSTLAWLLPLLPYVLLPLGHILFPYDPPHLRRSAVLQRLWVHSILVFAILGFLLSIAANWEHRRCGSVTYPSRWKRLLVLFTLIMVGMGLLAQPSFVRAQESSLIGYCINRLRIIDSAKEQYAMAKDLKPGAVVTYGQISEYIGPRWLNSTNCTYGGAFIIGAIGEEPRCPVHDGAMGYIYPERGCRYVDGKPVDCPKTKLIPGYRPSALTGRRAGAGAEIAPLRGGRIGCTGIWGREVGCGSLWLNDN